MPVYTFYIVSKISNKKYGHLLREGDKNLKERIYTASQKFLLM